LPPGGWHGVQQNRGGGRPHGRDRLLQIGERRRVHAQVQADAEQLGLAAGDPVGQFGGIIGGGLGDRVTQPAFFGIGASVGLQPRALLAQPGGGDLGGKRVDVHDDVEAAGPGQQRVQPGAADLGRVAG
jgi:hypothetical protein